MSTDGPREPNEDAGCFIFSLIFLAWAWITGMGLEAIFGQWLKIRN